MAVDPTISRVCVFANTQQILICTLPAGGALSDDERASPLLGAVSARLVNARASKYLTELAESFGDNPGEAWPNADDMTNRRICAGAVLRGVQARVGESALVAVFIAFDIIEAELSEFTGDAYCNAVDDFTQFGDSVDVALINLAGSVPTFATRDSAFACLDRAVAEDAAQRAEDDLLRETLRHRGVPLVVARGWLYPLY